MKEHIGDIVLRKLYERRDLLRKTLRNRYKATQPFRMKPMTEAEEREILRRGEYAEW